MIWFHTSTLYIVKRNFVFCYRQGNKMQQSYKIFMWWSLHSYCLALRQTRGLSRWAGWKGLQMLVQNIPYTKIQLEFLLGIGPNSNCNLNFPIRNYLESSHSIVKIIPTGNWPKLKMRLWFIFNFKLRFPYG